MIHDSIFFFSFAFAFCVLNLRLWLLRGQLRRVSGRASNCSRPFANVSGAMCSGTTAARLGRVPGLSSASPGTVQLARCRDGANAADCNFPCAFSGPHIRGLRMRKAVAADPTSTPASTSTDCYGVGLGGYAPGDARAGPSLSTFLALFAFRTLHFVEGCYCSTVSQ